jgi:hypothetical protein
MCVLGLKMRIKQLEHLSSAVRNGLTITATRQRSGLATCKGIVVKVHQVLKKDTNQFTVGKTAMWAIWCLMASCLSFEFEAAQKSAQLLSELTLIFGFIHNDSNFCPPYN